MCKLRWWSYQASFGIDGRFLKVPEEHVHQSPTPPQRSGWKCKYCEKANSNLYPQEVTLTWRSHHEKTNHRLMSSRLPKKQGGGGRVKAPKKIFFNPSDFGLLQYFTLFFLKRISSMWETGKLFQKPCRGKFSLQVSFRCLPRIIRPTVGGVRSFFLPGARWNPEDYAESQTSGLSAGKGRGIYIAGKQLSLGRFSRTVIASSK